MMHGIENMPHEHIFLMLMLCLGCNENGQRVESHTPVQDELISPPELHVDFLRPQDLGALLDVPFHTIQRFGFEEESTTTCAENWTLHTAFLPYDWPERESHSKFELYAFQGNIKIVAIEITLPIVRSEDERIFLKNYQKNTHHSKEDEARYLVLLTSRKISPYNCYSLDLYLEEQCAEKTSLYSRKCSEHLITRVEYFPSLDYRLRSRRDTKLTENDLSLIFNYPAYSNYVSKKSPWGQSLILYSNREALMDFAHYMTEDLLPTGRSLKARTRTNRCRL